MNKQKLHDTLSPYPSGEQFLKLFKSGIIDIKHLPYMHRYSLNQDIVLYRAMLIVLSIRTGIIEAHLGMAYDDDTVSDRDKTDLTDSLEDQYKDTVDFMSSPSMMALRDNEYHNEHENKARLTCYRFLKEY